MSKRLLVVDDALIIREMIKDAARSDGWEIVGEAAHGRDAVDRFVGLKPDVMTLDLVMPDYDGLYALREIRKLNREACIVVVSALDQQDILAEAVQLGIHDFIVKPFDPQRLLSTLDSAAGLLHV